MHVSVRGRNTLSRTRFFPRCATNSAGMSKSPRAVEDQTMPQPTVSENPLTAGMAKTLLPQPCILLIFGAAGDLSWRKLLPAVYNLNVEGVLPSNFAIVGFGVGSQGDPDEWIRGRARDGVNRFSRRPPDEGHWADFARALFYVEGSF